MSSDNTHSSNSDDQNPTNILDTAAVVISREFQQFISELETLIKSTNSDDRSAFETASASLQARAHTLKQRFDQISSTVQSSACNSAKTADLFAHRNPWYLAGIGACLGLLVGATLTKRN
jgi:ElaB/YqjD/DUF883 family membrane-anchored ribosome-binding protein